MTRDRILVVDDSANNRMVATGHLEAAGFEVVQATSGEQALELLDTEKIDLVVLDILMPGIGGYETCRRIRQHPRLAETPVLFLTALGDREATAPALAAGADDLLPKPFHRPELLLRVKALIRQRRTTDQLRTAMRALAEQNEQLRRADHDKRRMNELIVRDLKNPLGEIIGNAEALREPVPTAEAAEIAADILIAARQIEHTVRDLLDLSRAEDSTLAPLVETFDLAELAGEVAASLRGLARWSDVTITTEVHDLSAVADRELTRRLLQNLVHNAIAHAPTGTTVTIDACRTGANLVVHVRDEGAGVPTFTDDDHRNLGLAFCRLAAEAHGGRIWVEGATFCVEIPQP